MYGISITTLLLIILSIFFIIIFFIDLKHYIIPNELTFPLMLIGFVKSFDPNLNQSLFPNYINSLAKNLLKIIFRNKEGMGLGDAKLIAVVGFWFGWFSIPFTIFISSVVALVYSIPSLMNKSRDLSTQIPFGPFIIIGCLIYVTFANQIKNLFL